MSNCIDILARDVVAFHFCQLDDEPTCLIPEFVHNLAAQLSRCPQLASFRSLLESNPELMGLVTYSHCLENPSRAFVKGILEPLALLRSQGKVSGQRWIFGHFLRFSAIFLKFGPLAGFWVVFVIVSTFFQLFKGQEISEAIFLCFNSPEKPMFYFVFIQLGQIKNDKRTT